MGFSTTVHAPRLALSPRPHILILVREQFFAMQAANLSVCHSVDSDLNSWLSVRSSELSTDRSSPSSVALSPVSFGPLPAATFLACRALRTESTLSRIAFQQCTNQAA